MKKLALFCFAGVLSLSCVNEDYDFSKIDGTAVIGKDLALPIGSLETIKVGNIITIDESDPMILKEPDGDYAFRFSGGAPIQSQISVPSFSLMLEDNSKGDDHYITLNTGALAGKNGPAENTRLDLQNQRVEKIIKVAEADKLPYQIKDIKSLTTGMVFEYNFSTETGACHIAEGFQMDFPDWMTIERADDNDYIVENQGDNKNIVRFVNDVKVVAGTPYIIDLKLTEVVFPENSVVPAGNDSQGRPCKKIHLDETDPANQIIATGAIYAETKDFPTIPEKINLKMHLEFKNIEYLTALVSLDMQMTSSDKSVQIASYPDFFDSSDIVVDLYDPQLRFIAKSDFPLPLDLNADIAGLKGSTEVVRMHLGDNGGEKSTEPMIIPALWEGTLAFSKLGKDGAIRLPELGDLLMAKPEEIRVSDINITAPDDYMTIENGKSLNASIEYELYAPLAFGNDFRFAYCLDINDIGLDLKEYGLKTASIILNATNSIPLDFSVVAHALNAEDQPADDLSLEVVGNVASGTQDEPVTSPVEIKLKSSGEGIELNSLKLVLTATCPTASHQGVPLNEAQGLKISGLSLRLPDGITVDMTAIFKMDPAPEEEYEEM